jgi:hypothetical protein
MACVRFQHVIGSRGLGPRGVCMRGAWQAARASVYAAAHPATVAAPKAHNPSPAPLLMDTRRGVPMTQNEKQHVIGHVKVRCGGAQRPPHQMWRARSPQQTRGASPGARPCPGPSPLAAFPPPPLEALHLRALQTIQVPRLHISGRLTATPPRHHSPDTTHQTPLPQRHTHTHTHTYTHTPTTVPAPPTGRGRRPRQ